MTDSNKIERLVQEVGRLTDAVEILTDLVLEQQKLLFPLNEVLVKATDVTKYKGLSRNTIGMNRHVEKYNEFGKKKLLISLESVSVVKNRKSKFKKKKA